MTGRFSVKVAFCLSLYSSVDSIEVFKKITGDEAGENTGDNATYEENRKIPENIHSAGDNNGDENLSDVMGTSAEHAETPELLQ